MQAEPLEKFVEAPRSGSYPDLPSTLNGMWRNRKISTDGYRKDRHEIRARIRKNEKKTIVKAKSAESIADLIGSDAKEKWARLTEARDLAGEMQMNLTLDQG